MSKEHFNTGSGEAKGYSGYEGILSPTNESAPEAKAQGRGRRLKVADSESGAEAGQGGGIVEDTPAERAAKVARDTTERVPFTGGGKAPKEQHAGQSMKTGDIHRSLESIHKLVTGVANGARSIRSLHPDHQAMVIGALQHLNDAGIHLSNGKAVGLGTNNANNAEAKNHFSNGLRSITKAHRLLSDPGLQKKLASHNIAGELPLDEHLATMQAHIGTMRGRGRGGTGENRPFPNVLAGRMSIPTQNISPEDLDRARQLGGKDHILVKKIESALAGSKPGEDLVGEKAYKEAAEKGQVRSNKRGVTRGTRVNPNKPASSATVKTRLTSDGSKIGKTPTFGESGGTGRQARLPRESSGKPSDPARKNINQNRGSKGGAV